MTPDSSDQLINKVQARPKADDETQTEPQLRTVARKGERQGDRRRMDDGWEMAGIDRHRTDEEPFREAANEGGEGWDCYECLASLSRIIRRWANAIRLWCMEMVTRRG